ncbi:MAG: hypothetical protein ACLP2Y_15465 [Limisphaerales bacterium]
MKSDSRAGNLLPSGIVFSPISFVIGLGKPAFQGVLGRHLAGRANTAMRRARWAV